MMSRPPFDRRRLATLGAACLCVATACSTDGTIAPTRDEAALAVSVFTQLADSVARSRGDSEVSSAYASLAEAVRQGGRISPIVITVDGVSMNFLATAQQNEPSVSFCGGDPKCISPLLLARIRSLIAWQRDDPRKIIQLSSVSDADPIRAYVVPTDLPLGGPSASLTFYDGKGGLYFGTSGSQKFSITTSTNACEAATAAKSTVSVLPPPGKCTQANFSIAFSGRADPSSFLAAKNTATGSHTFSMTAQPVLGSRLELVASVPALPPIKIMPTVALPATLVAKVDNEVTLTLTVSNPSSTPVQITFGNSQEFEFTIGDAATGATLWRWSTNYLFAQRLSTKTISPNGSLVYTGVWVKPTRLGAMFATASLVSLSHRADVKMAVNVP